MFKNSSFANEIFHSMEKTLVSNQVENKYGFNKLAKAADYLNAAAEVFEKAGMHKQAIEVTEVLQGLLHQLSGKTSTANEHHTKCNCERMDCKHGREACKNKAGDKKVMYIGAVCDECAENTPKKYMK